MSSQLNVDTIVDKSGSGGSNVKVANTSTYVSDGGAVTQNLVQGIAKFWSNHDGTGSSNDSYNQGSITDNGTGDFQLNFTNNMNNNDYSSNVSGSDANSNSTVILAVNDINQFQTSSITHFVVSEDSGAQDVGPVCCTVHGDLA